MRYNCAVNIPNNIKRSDCMQNSIPTELSVNGKNYSVIKLLGKGKGGYSYLASDGTNQYVLKQIHHEPCSYYQFGDKIQSELNDYNRLKKSE